MPGGFPKIRTVLEVTGFDIIDSDVSEMRKMDGGPTFRARNQASRRNP